MKIFLILILLFFIGCSSAQIKSNYLINFLHHPNAAKYIIFFEERPDSNFQLKDSLDYLEPVNLSPYKITELNVPSTVSLNLLNDGKFIRAAVVVEDTAGFYSLMGVSPIYKKGLIPPKPSDISITRIQ